MIDRLAHIKGPAKRVLVNLWLREQLEESASKRRVGETRNGRRFVSLQTHYFEAKKYRIIREQPALPWQVHDTVWQKNADWKCRRGQYLHHLIFTLPRHLERHGRIHTPPGWTPGATFSLLVAHYGKALIAI